MSSISIIIPHYNGWEVLDECLSSLHKTEGIDNFEIIVVDNSSSDDSIIKAKKKYSLISIVSSAKNLGYSGGCNLGARKAKGKFLVFLNNDTIMEKNWLKILEKKINSNSNIASVQPKIKNFYKKSQFDYAGGSGGYIDLFCFPFVRGRIFDSLENDCCQYDNSCPIFWASGTAFITRKSLFDQIGGFDETMFMHMEEIDYHWKSQLLGYSVWIEPMSVIYHKGGATLAYSSPLKTYFNHRNSLILLLTNYNVLVSLILFLPRLLMELVAFIRYFLSGKLNHSFAQLKAWIWIIFNPHIIIKRYKSLSKLRKNNKMILETIYNNSIVYQYFIKNKKTYKNLFKGS